MLLNVGAAMEAERIFHALAENGTVQMPLQETFWALRFGMLIDPSGHRGWSTANEGPDTLID